MRKEPLQPILITGCQRSGTTLLRKLLGRHPAVLEHPDEPQFILELFRRFGHQIPDVRVAVEYLLRHPYLPETLTEDALWDTFNSKRSLTLQEFFDRYLHLWGEDQLASQRPLLKDPYFVFNLNDVARIFPGAALLHIIRDPRGAISSQKTRWSRYTTRETTRIWKTAVHLGSRWCQAHPESTYEIIYEQLIQDPETTLRGLCRFLGIPFEPAILTPAWKQTGRSNPGRAGSALDASRISGWETDLSRHDVRYIENSCREEMMHLGYEFRSPAVPETEYAAFLIREALVDTYRTSGRRVKQILRKTGWKMGFGILKIPEKKAG